MYCIYVLFRTGLYYPLVHEVRFSLETMLLGVSKDCKCMSEMIKAKAASPLIVIDTVYDILPPFAKSTDGGIYPFLGIYDVGINGWYLKFPD